MRILLFYARVWFCASVNLLICLVVIKLVWKIIECNLMYLNQPSILQWTCMVVLGLFFLLTVSQMSLLETRPHLQEQWQITYVGKYIVYSLKLTQTH